MSPRIEDGPRPKHVQLSDVLAELATRDLGPGASIPSERGLHDGVRRLPRHGAQGHRQPGGRRAPGEDPRQGHLRRATRVQTSLHLASFSDDMHRRGLVPATRLMRVDEERPPPEVVKALRLGPRGTAWRIDRVRLADGQPMAIEQGWYRAPSSRASRRGPHRLALHALREQLRPRHRRCRADPVGRGGGGCDRAPPRRPVHTPLLVFRRVSTAAGRPVEYVVSRYRGDRYQVHMSLGATPDAVEEAAPTAPPEGDSY